VKAAFELKIGHVRDTEVACWKELLDNAIYVYHETLKGHSYQSMTGLVPAAGERLLPTLQDLQKRRRLQELNDTMNVCREAQFF
jgi:hypothetical protein